MELCTDMFNWQISAHMYVERGLFGELWGGFDWMCVREAPQSGRKSTSGRSKCLFYHSGDSVRPSGGRFNNVCLRWCAWAHGPVIVATESLSSLPLRQHESALRLILHLFLVGVTFLQTGSTRDFSFVCHVWPYRGAVLLLLPNNRGICMILLIKASHRT